MQDLEDNEANANCRDGKCTDARELVFHFLQPVILAIILPEFYTTIAPKIFSRFIFFGGEWVMGSEGGGDGGHVPLSLAVSYTPNLVIFWPCICDDV